MAKLYTAKVLLALTPKMRDALNKKARLAGKTTMDFLRDLIAGSVGMGRK